jgi:hypothetical protein
MNIIVHVCINPVISTFPQWVIIPGVVVAIPFIFIKTMKEIAFTSAIGAIATLAVVLIVLISSLQNLPTGPIEHDDVIWDQFPVALSTIAFSFGKFGVCKEVYCVRTDG